jgi:hypothetical protein
MATKEKKYECLFTTCLLALGPPPGKPMSLQAAGEAARYKDSVTQWFIDWHDCDPLPKRTTAQRFARLFISWCQVHESNKEYDVWIST